MVKCFNNRNLWIYFKLFTQRLFYKDKYYNIEKFTENVPYIFKNEKLYLKLDQFEFDRYSTKFPISSNGQVYKHILNHYYRFYKNDL